MTARKKGSLIDRKGEVVSRFAPTVTSEQLKMAIEEQL
jgi:glutathione peroxidase-family protein